MRVMTFINAMGILWLSASSNAWAEPIALEIGKVRCMGNSYNELSSEFVSDFNGILKIESTITATSGGPRGHVATRVYFDNSQCAFDEKYQGNAGMPVTAKGVCTVDVRSGNHYIIKVNYSDEITTRDNVCLKISR